MKTDARERGCKQAAAVKAPENGPGLARENAGHEEHCAGGVMAARAVLAEFMHGTQGEAATRKCLIDICYPERKHRLLRGRASGNFHHPAKLGQWNRC
ncbi:hypothetical protein [Bradyrhizobium japonicum]|uniref:hypothetical protein n=1 Tax=Bradyrhizobium japonicum TaxID=375 RepID=UPI002715006E|nr:hypothetical protein [Bradyrhizobium japonicum]WLB24121.1 hypothetical protein QIH95_50300 [Bradyrhizobium japonicum]